MGVIAEFEKFSKVVVLSQKEALKLTDLFLRLSPPEHCDPRNAFTAVVKAACQNRYDEILANEMAVVARRPQRYAFAALQNQVAAVPARRGFARKPSSLKRVADRAYLDSSRSSKAGFWSVCRLTKCDLAAENHWEVSHIYVGASSGDIRLGTN